MGGVPPSEQSRAGTSLQWEKRVKNGKSVPGDRKMYRTTSVLTVGGEVSEGEGGLALDLETRAVHEHNQALHKLRLGCSELLSVSG